jgi:hypothetical protein
VGLTARSEGRAGVSGGADDRRRTVGLTVLLAVVAFCVLAVLLQVTAIKLVQGVTAEHAKTVNDARVSLIQLLGGIGLIGGFIYTARTFALTRATQRADRFTRAIEQIGDKDSETVRAGGVYSLRLLTMEEGVYWPVVEDVLSALIRERAKPGDPITADVHAALTVIGSRSDQMSAERRPLDLRKVHLPGTNLVSANLKRAWLADACLDGADLTDARLAGASLTGASLEVAELASADFTEADLTGANLRRANFYLTVMTSAELSGCYLTGARNLSAEQLAGTMGDPAAPPVIQ